jgi:cytoskeletal protein CcmA (bactofilin family)
MVDISLFLGFIASAGLKTNFNYFYYLMKEDQNSAHKERTVQRTHIFPIKPRAHKDTEMNKEGGGKMRRIVMVIMGLSLVFPFVSGGAYAATFRAGPNALVPASETLDDNLYAAGETVVVEGEIGGDAVLAGREVRIDGTINRDLAAGGQKILINGNVEDDLRVGGANIQINGKVMGDVLVGGGTLTISDGSWIGNDLTFGATNAFIGGVLGGKILGGGKNITISGEVKGDVKLEAENIILMPTAEIKGDFSYKSLVEAEIQSGAQVHGTVTHLPREQEKEVLFEGIGKMFLILRILLSVGIIALGVVIFAIFPQRTRAITDTLRSAPWKSLGLGAAFLVGAPIAMAILGVTVIGIPIGGILLLGYMLILSVGIIYLGLLLGRWLLKLIRGEEPSTKGSLILAIIIGLVILVAVVNIPYLGFVGIIYALLGPGALILNFIRGAREAREEASI